MSIKFISEEKIFVLETVNSCYQIQIDRAGCLRHLYYGRPVGNALIKYLYRGCDRGFSGNPYEQSGEPGFSFDTIPQEYSCFGTGDYRVSALETELENGSRSVDLRYDSYRIRDGKYELCGLPYVRSGKDSVQTLEILLKDRTAGLSVLLKYGVFEEKDIVTRAAEIINDSQCPVKLMKASSMSIDFLTGDFDLIHFAGRHCMERQPKRVPLQQNIVTVGSKRGMSSHQNNPFVILCDKKADEDQGDCYGFMLAYSGGHKEEIEKDQTGSVRVTAGIQDEGFCWRLSPGEAFQTPEAILAYSKDGLNGLSQKYHRIIRENICDPKYLDKKRPVLLNSWEAFYFDFDEEKLLGLAGSAKELGVEMLVLDDGWFGQRLDDHAGLGDWFVNENKIKGGLKKLVDAVNAEGLEFGLWVEPEMVNENSDLYRAHPDWALADPDRLPVLARNQLVLDMSRKDVRDYLFDCISTILKEANVRYLKWDFNRSTANVFSYALPAERQGEVPHRFVLGIYELLARLNEAFPDVMIEGCAGGGGRFDAGMLFYCPQIWCSDNTDPVARLKIQEGTSYGYPVSTMGSHVSASPNHQTGRSTPFSSRGVTAMSGTFGYELNPALLTEGERQQMREQIADFHKYYWLIQKGTYYRLKMNEASHSTAWEFVSEDKGEALVNIAAMDVECNVELPFIRLKGLDEEKVYWLEGTDLAVTGAALMYAGLTLDQFKGDYPAVQLHFIS